jgi:hypothetical protein
MRIHFLKSRNSDAGDDEPDALRIASNDSKFRDLKFEDNPSRDSQVTLAPPKETVVNGIQLNARGDAFNELVVHASTNREGKGGVGIGNAPTGIGLMCETQEQFSEWRISAFRN